MKNCRTVLITSLLIILSVYFSVTNFAQEKLDDLRFWIELDKKVFFVSESIWLDMYVQNLGKQKVGVKPLSLAGGWLEILLINSENDTLEPQGKEHIEWIGEGPTFSLEPNETLFICRNVLEATSIGEPEEPGPGSWRTYLKPDTYRIKAIYKTRLASTELTFQVMNPSGNKKKAYDLWKEGMKNYGKAQWQLAVSKWKELLSKYPKSVYAPSICRELDYYDRANSKKYAQKLFLEHPNSGYSEFVIGVLLENKSEEERETILQEIEKKFAGTRAAKFVNNIRKGIIAY
ncbi:MAG: hypothetical protein GTO24_28210 [candidate division Zixibacteria bacterium]|nr:hypothetical protein [candidate division Zixibacteria bacterium]